MLIKPTHKSVHVLANVFLFFSIEFNLAPFVTSFPKIIIAVDKDDREHLETAPEITSQSSFSVASLPTSSAEISLAVHLN